mmetsp:Transcript_17323/g.42774  ORF Transcript_17323/g.42774 Transcript_17323/m.42774 type:complete len:155 (-) Transcript_17323:180-644(-)
MFAFNDQLLRKSLVKAEKTLLTPKRQSPPVPKNSKGGKHHLEHLRRVAYPMSLVEGPKSASAPISVQAGIQARLTSAEHAAARNRCAINATPARTEHCESASVAADAALDRYHEAAYGVEATYGIEDGHLQDVVDLSLAMDVACDIDDLWDHKE